MDWESCVPESSLDTGGKEKRKKKRDEGEGRGGCLVWLKCQEFASPSTKVVGNGGVVLWFVRHHKNVTFPAAIFCGCTGFVDKEENISSSNVFCAYEKK